MDDTNSLIEQRRAKLEALRAKGIDPFKNKFTPDHQCKETRDGFESGQFPEGYRVAVAGRITAHREMGKSMFIDVRDQSGRIQVYAQKNVLGDEHWHTFTHLDLGDFIGVTGTLFRTKTGEPSIKLGGVPAAPAQPSGEAVTPSQPSGDEASPPPPFVILAKALRPPPAKWHGLEDTEIRYRQRYLDLIANPDVKDVFLKRSAIIHEIRQFFHSRGYVEVETPAMQAIPGGAAAQPFKTFHNALGCEFYLRIAIELYHKRLLVGGIDKLFEIGKNFRNEGLSRRHNPEFTMLEAYQAFGDYATMMELVQSLICHVAQKVLGTLVIKHEKISPARTVVAAATESGKTAEDVVNILPSSDLEKRDEKVIDLTPPWKRAKYKDLVRAVAGNDWFEVTPEERRRRAIEDLKLEGDIAKGYEDFEVTGAVFEKLIEPTLIQPTFVTHLPKELVPLAKLSPDDPTTVEVFECCINGQEISPGYTEQNDPIQQRTTLEHQAGGEQQKLDEDFLVALEHGMPPAGGIGIGIDRLCMMLLGQESIRDVILFPQLKPK
ncbi:MAG: lysine--tRNA ligase [Verrucomicrobiae bacterium]|nr:lysine--tRNA ligase [Verrucomicrobiae bacterium]